MTIHGVLSLSLQFEISPGLLKTWVIASIDRRQQAVTVLLTRQPRQVQRTSFCRSTFSTETNEPILSL